MGGDRGGLEGKGGQGGGENFFSHPNDLLIWAYPENLVKIGLLSEALDTLCGTGREGRAQVVRVQEDQALSKGPKRPDLQQNGLILKGFTFEPKSIHNYITHQPKDFLNYFFDDVLKHSNQQEETKLCN